MTTTLRRSRRAAKGAGAACLRGAGSGPGYPVVVTRTSHSPLTRRTLLTSLAAAGAGVLAGCAPQTAPRTSPGPDAAASATPASGPPSPTPSPTPATAALMAERAVVPTLCYHQVRPWQSSDSEYTRNTLVCPPERFSAHLDGLAEAGYTTISPAQYLAHLTTGAALPSRPILLTFDDGKDNQATTALPELARRGMTGTLFIMTVVLDKPGWISSDQVRALADSGMTIGAHTWDHQKLSKLPDGEWATQLEKPRETLRRLSGQEVDTLAFPYGIWAPHVLPHVAAAGYATAFQLDGQPLDSANPLLTLRRRMTVSTWTPAQLIERLAGI